MVYGYPQEQCEMLQESVVWMPRGWYLSKRFVFKLRHLRSVHCGNAMERSLSSVPSDRYVSPAIAQSPQFAYAPSERAGRFGNARVETITRPLHRHPFITIRYSSLLVSSCPSGLFVIHSSYSSLLCARGRRSIEISLKTK